MTTSIGQDLAERIKAKLAAKRAEGTSTITFAEFLSSPDFCNRNPSPAVMAIVHASEGRPVTTIDDATCKEVFGCYPDKLPRTSKRIVVVGAGRRSGKTTQLLAPKALHAAWTVALPNLSHGERARAVIIGPKRDHAAGAFAIVRGLVHASPILSRAVVQEKAESLVLRRPDGKEVEIIVGSANHGGQDVRSRTLVFLGMDEACFFYDESYTANDRDIFEGAEPALEPGAQAWIISTPWIEGAGFHEALIALDHGKHESALVAARVSTRLFRPSWDADGEIEKAMLRRPDGRANVDREIYARPFPRGSVSFFDIVAVHECFAKHPPKKDVVEKGAGIDLGFKNDFSALVIAHRLRQGDFTVPVALERKPKPGQPLRPSEVRREFADTMRTHKISEVWADSFSASDTQEQFASRGISLRDAPSGADGKVSVYEAAREIIHGGKLYLGHLDNDTKESLKEQLASIVRRQTSGGKVEISAPRKRLSELSDGTVTGGHADSVSALVLALWACGARVDQTYEDESPLPYKPPTWPSQTSSSSNAWNRSGGTRGWR